ncbi:hypothetical protein [Butyrivibrio fibrisolvens]|uniref:Uncharacterized protein n=1 Tax=Butyrivibrio fibrisolvens TaxID=831 RepID=A0A317G0J0_BUTFI|nr:hypothetical protein [Butyrivibrio fibrisolvens]PWT25972.1 hypothetical protein CPT75_00890 [Butyrivibrio fibrisolvens]
MNQTSTYIKDEYWNKFYYQMRAFVIGMTVGMIYCVAERWDISALVSNMNFRHSNGYIVSSLMFGLSFLIIYTAAVFVLPWFNRRSENVKVLLVVFFPITLFVSSLIGIVAFIPYTLHCLYRAYF